MCTSINGQHSKTLLRFYPRFQLTKEFDYQRIKGILGKRTKNQSWSLCWIASINQPLRLIFAQSSKPFKPSNLPTFQPSKHIFFISNSWLDKGKLQIVFHCISLKKCHYKHICICGISIYLIILYFKGKVTVRGSIQNPFHVVCCTNSKKSTNKRAMAPIIVPFQCTELVERWRSREVEK